MKRNQQMIAGQDTYIITHCNFSVCNTTTWILYIENLIHIYNLLQGLQVSRMFENSKRFLNDGDGSYVPILALEIIKQVFNSNSIILSDCHYCSLF